MNTILDTIQQFDQKRVYLRNHYPSEVLVGGILGIAYGVLFL